MLVTSLVNFLLTQFIIFIFKSLRPVKGDRKVILENCVIDRTITVVQLILCIPHFHPGILIEF